MARIATDGHPHWQHTHPNAPGYLFLEYPKHRHHLVYGWRNVETREEEERLTPDEEGWTDDLLEVEASRVVSTDTVSSKPKRSHHKKVATPDAPLDPPVVLTALSTD